METQSATLQYAFYYLNPKRFPNADYSNGNGLIPIHTLSQQSYAKVYLSSNPEGLSSSDDGVSMIRAVIKSSSGTFQVFDFNVTVEATADLDVENVKSSLVSPHVRDTNNNLNKLAQGIVCVTTYLASDSGLSALTLPARINYRMILAEALASTVNQLEYFSKGPVAIAIALLNEITQEPRELELALCLPILEFSSGLLAKADDSLSVPTIGGIFASSFNARIALAAQNDKSENGGLSMDNLFDRIIAQCASNQLREVHINEDALVEAFSYLVPSERDKSSIALTMQKTDCATRSNILCQCCLSIQYRFSTC